MLMPHIVMYNSGSVNNLLPNAFSAVLSDPACGLRPRRLQPCMPQATSGTGKLV